ncbi:hypothetical protein GYB22_09810 [bacterium]|nr:hypothetical protein [bacterium]
MIKVSHPTGILNAEIQLPASKSISNRYLILKHLYAPDLTVKNLSEANDTELMQKALLAQDLINVEDAGTVMRFVLATCASREGIKTITGSPRMLERPVVELVDALSTLGADIEYLEEEGRLPLEVKGAPLKYDGELDLREVRSSQFVSAIIMILPLVKGDITIRINPAMNSFSYVQLTLDVMKTLGFRFEFDSENIKYIDRTDRPAEVWVDSDFSSFYYWFSAAALSNEANLSFGGFTNPELQHEWSWLKDLKFEGLEVEWEQDTIFLRKHQGQQFKLPQLLEFKNVPDLAPTFILLAAAGLENEYLIRGIESLKYKESDREAVLISYLGVLGSELQAAGNNWLLSVSSFHIPQGHRFEVYEDHRMAMSLAPLGLISMISVEDPEVVVKSYPKFWDDLKKANFVIEEQ